MGTFVELSDASESSSEQSDESDVSSFSSNAEGEGDDVTDPIASIFKKSEIYYSRIYKSEEIYTSEKAAEERVWSVTFDKERDLAYLFVARLQHLYSGSSYSPVIHTRKSKPETQTNFNPRDYKINIDDTNMHKKCLKNRGSQQNLENLNQKSKPELRLIFKVIDLSFLKRAKFEIETFYIEADISGSALKVMQILENQY